MAGAYLNVWMTVFVCGAVNFMVLLVYLQQEQTMYSPLLYRNNSVFQMSDIKGGNSTSLGEIYVNPHNYELIHNEIDMCRTQNGGGEILLVIVVCSAPENVRQRFAIRNTWGKGTKRDEMNSRLVFLVGKPKTIPTQYLINNESSRFRDVIQEDFVDSYRNLSVKSVAALKWVSVFCKNAQYMLKVDDDIFVNVKNLVALLKDSYRVKRFIMGSLQAYSEPKRNPNSKWYTPYSSYPNDTYPKYISGTAYVMTGDIVPEMYRSSLSTPLFWLEDIYITGLCARKVPHVPLLDHPGFNFGQLTKDICVIKNSISHHYVSPEQMLRIWRKLKTKSCF